MQQFHQRVGTVCAANVHLLFVISRDIPTSAVEAGLSDNNTQ